MKTIFYTLTGLVCLFRTAAQDLQVTQLYAAPMFVNPAFTGANVCSRVTLSSRNQWTGITRSYRTNVLSVDHNIYRVNSGIGLIAGTDEAGSGNLKTTFVSVAYAYEARINKNSSLRFGLQPGFGQRSVNFSQLTFGDQIYRGGNVATVEKETRTTSYFDLAAGAVYYRDIWWVGASAFHINLPNESFYDSPFGTLPVKYDLHAGAKFEFDAEDREATGKRSISPVIHYKGQGKFDQLDLGLYFTKNIFTLGFWYRGLPVIKDFNRVNRNHDAIAFIGGVETRRMKIGYAYDHTISGLQTASKGAHEISLAFQLCKTNKRKVKHRLISCPKF